MVWAIVWSNILKMNESIGKTTFLSCRASLIWYHTSVFKLNVYMHVGLCDKLQNPYVFRDILDSFFKFYVFIVKSNGGQ